MEIKKAYDPSNLDRSSWWEVSRAEKLVGSIYRVRASMAEGDAPSWGHVFKAADPELTLTPFDLEQISLFIHGADAIARTI
jgi:hypothetical protein